MQSVSSRIWTRIVVSNSIYKPNWKTTEDVKADMYTEFSLSKFLKRNENL